MRNKISVDRAFLGGKWRLSGQQSVFLIAWVACLQLHPPRLCDWHGLFLAIDVAV